MSLSSILALLYDGFYHELRRFGLGVCVAILRIFIEKHSVNELFLRSEVHEVQVRHDWPLNRDCMAAGGQNFLLQACHLETSCVALLLRLVFAACANGLLDLLRSHRLRIARWFWRVIIDCWLG